MLNIDVKDIAGQRVVSVSGEVDLSTSPKLWKEIQIAFKGTTALRIRLTDVSYIDSTGIAVLVQSYKHAQKKKVYLALLDPSPNVLAVVELARLNDLFTIETTA